MQKKNHTYYFIAETYSSNLPTASVVRKDNEKILQQLGFQPLLFRHIKPGSLLIKLRRLNELAKFALSVKKGSLVVFHFPFLANAYKVLLQLFGRRSVQTAALIIDIDGLRYKDESLLKKEIETLQQFNYVIAHNAAMKNFLAQYIHAEKIYCMDMFDYPAGNISPQRKLSNTICYAGNFEKALFVNGLGHIAGVQFNLYGPSFAAAEKQNIAYKGIFDSKELPKKLEGSFGLVWDGGSIENCDEYLRYNNPHKLSLYLSAGLPVIVWKESAVAGYVVKNEIGLAVSTLAEIGETIHKISQADYDTMLKNIEPIQQQIIHGGFLKKAMAQIIS